MYPTDPSEHAERFQKSVYLELKNVNHLAKVPPVFGKSTSESSARLSMWCQEQPSARGHLADDARGQWEQIKNNNYTLLRVVGYCYGILLGLFVQLIQDYMDAIGIL